MSDALQVAVREVKTGFRNPWAYSFMALFAVFMLGLLLINGQGYVAGYSGVTGTMLNLMLYLLPLMTLMLGAVSLTSEKEEGSWELLASYPLRTTSFMLGKYAGLGVVLLVIAALGFGLAGVAGTLLGQPFAWQAYGLLLVFAASLILLYLAIALLVGTLARTRWQALTIAVAIWFFTVIGWAPLLIASLGAMPYMWIKPAVVGLTLLNPAELSRLFAVVKLGGGAVLGPEYYEWIKWIRQPSGTGAYAAWLALWIGCAAGLATWLWERGRRRG
ncbi:ABC transporter permease [Paenibacillus sp. IB182496]|uniref:ABC transporter permease n=1 Tax=Paenibacillus sabuli TaxID=2772509 RepID=A0A927GTC9_9BACL|nr:ABC transporter permease [Paenibacillus sabuli]MBD2847694.1 ABC transporter permease [Paenibacillus sabuli]